MSGSHARDYLRRYFLYAPGQSEPITIYHIGEEWWDLCAGPHVENTGQLPAQAIKLENLVRERAGQRKWGAMRRG